MPEPKMLSIEEFAERMQISRQTVFEWMDKNVLVQGRHYLKQGRITRFPWSGELVSRMLEDCLQSQAQEESQPKPAKPVSPREKEKPRKQVKGSQINWDYK